MLEIEPRSGFFGNMTFTLAASEGWEDDDLPLMFEFGYCTQDSEEVCDEFLGTPSEENNLEVDVLPQGTVYYSNY